NVVLGDVAEARAAAQRAGAGVGLLAAGQQAEKGRFAGAVGADQADTFASAQVKRKVGKQRAGTVALGQSLGAQQEDHARPRLRCGWSGEAVLAVRSGRLATGN